MVTVKFVGGPRDGKTVAYPKDPIMLGCHDEAREVGMFGVYRTGGSIVPRATEGEVTATWEELPRPKKPDCN